MNTPFTINCSFTDGECNVSASPQGVFLEVESMGSAENVVVQLARPELKDLLCQLEYVWKNSAGILRKAKEAEQDDVGADG